MSDQAPPRPAVRMVISGRVQGVSFRYFTRREAQRLGLAGRVRNLPSGEVEVRAQGEAEALELFRQRLRQGPPASRVDDIVEWPLAAPEEWQGFEITY